MKTKLSFIAIALMFSVLTLSGQGTRWRLLGERVVNDMVDHDVIMVTAVKGDMTALQIRVRGASVDFHRVVIVYGNGRKQDIELRNTIPAGGVSRAIDLIGDDRLVRSVEFWYDANTIRGRKAIIKLFGRG